MKGRYKNMLIIDYEDLDTSLRNIEVDYISEDRFLDIYEKDQLEILKKDFERSISKTTDSKEQEVLNSRIKKVNDILKIHEDKVEQAVAYLKKPFEDVPDYPEAIIEQDYKKILYYFDTDYLLNYGRQLFLKLEEVDFSTAEEEEVFIKNYKYLQAAIHYAIDLIENVEAFVKSDYPKIFRILEFKKAISFQEA